MKKGKMITNSYGYKGEVHSLPTNEKLCKKLRDTEKEINKRKMLSSCLHKDDDSVLYSNSNRSSKQSGTSGYYSMLPSARERVENQHYFKNYYCHLCEINKSVPKVNMQQDQMLQFYGDRIKYDDWMPIIKAIENDQSLRIIKILNRNLSQRGFTKDPAIFRRNILNSLTTALQKCLSESKILNFVRLESLPFSTINLKNFLNGLERNNNIEHIELPCCSLGNKGCEMLCQILRYKTNIKSIDLSSCGITSDGAQHIAGLIEAQTIIRYGDCWKQSLRYRHPSPGISNGLQRIILNNNTNLGDSGFTCIMNSLMDDLWITEVHCQNCGLTNDSADQAINLAKNNYFIRYIDIRRNLSVDSDLVNALEKLLTVNRSSIPFQGAWNSEVDFHESENKNNHRIYNNSKPKSFSSYSYSSNKDTISSSRLSRSTSSVAIGVPKLKISRVTNNESARKRVVTKQKVTDLQRTKKDLQEAKSKLFQEISKRVAVEKYCKQLELQLKDRDSYVLIEKSILAKLIKTFQEFSFTFSDTAGNENRLTDRSEDAKYDLDNIPLKFDKEICIADDKNKNKGETINTLDLGENMSPTQTKSKVNLPKNVSHDPKTRALELFKQLLDKNIIK